MNLRTYKDKEDKELLELFYADNDNEWLGILLQRYTLLLFGVCMKYLKNEEDARDAVQQIFLKVISELHKYKIEYFKSWLYMVAKNHCLMKLRKKDYTQQINDLITSDYADKDLAAELTEKEFRLDRMAAALLQLNKEQQQCITLFFLQKKSYQQIVGITGFTLMQVKSHIQNGKRNLKLQLDKMDNDR